MQEQLNSVGKNDDIVDEEEEFLIEDEEGEKATNVEDEITEMGTSMALGTSLTPAKL
jgi:hypothetical protein